MKSRHDEVAKLVDKKFGLNKKKSKRYLISIGICFLFLSLVASGAYVTFLYKVESTIDIQKALLFDGGEDTVIQEKISIMAGETYTTTHSIESKSKKWIYLLEVDFEFPSCIDIICKWKGNETDEIIVYPSTYEEFTLTYVASPRCDADIDCETYVEIKIKEVYK